MLILAGVESDIGLALNIPVHLIHHHILLALRNHIYEALYLNETGAGGVEAGADSQELLIIIQDILHLVAHKLSKLIVGDAIGRITNRLLLYPLLISLLYNSLSRLLLRLLCRLLFALERGAGGVIVGVHGYWWR